MSFEYKYYIYDSKKGVLYHRAIEIITRTNKRIDNTTEFYCVNSSVTGKWIGINNINYNRTILNHIHPQTIST